MGTYSPPPHPFNRKMQLKRKAREKDLNDGQQDLDGLCKSYKQDKWGNKV